MKRLLPFVIFMIFVQLSPAQNLKVSGVVYDEELNSLPYVNVMVVDSDTTMIDATATDDNGAYSFFLSVNEQRQHFLTVSHIAYEKQMIAINSNDTIINIYLQLAQTMLGNVEIVAKKPVFENKEGKIIVNVQQIANSENMSTAKVLSRLPGVTASDQEGVTLNGQSAAVYINGVEQRITGKMAVSLLESIPASSIDQIELVAMNDGTSSVLSNGVKINLKMKNLKYDGYSAKISGTAGWKELPDNVFGGGGNAFYIVKKNRLLFNASLSYKNDMYWSKSTENSQYADSTWLISKRTNSTRMNVLTGIANLNYEFKNSHRINFNFFFYDDFSNGHGHQGIERTDNIFTGVKYGKKGNDDLWTGNIEYSTPDTLKNSFVASYGILYGGTRAKNTQENYDNIIEDTVVWDLDSRQTMIGMQHDIKLNYKHIFNNKSTLKIGALVDYGNLNDNVNYDESSYTGKYNSSNFSGFEQNYETYINYGFKLGKVFYVSTALRYIYVRQDFDYKSYDLTLAKDYGYLFPYASITDNVGNYKFSLGITSGLAKPSYSTMLPGLRYVGDYTVYVGNPQVKPCTQYSLVFNQSILDYMFISIRFNRTYNLADYILNNESSSELTVYEYKNYADADNFYFRLSTPFRIFKDILTGNVNFEASYYDLINYKNGYKPAEDRTSSYWQCSVKGGLNYAITQHLNAYIWAQYVPTTKKPHTTNDERWSMDAGISYQWGRNDMFALSLNAENVFNTLQYNSTDYYQDMISNNLVQYNNRLVMLTFAVKFNGGEKVADRAVDYNKNDTDRFRK